jgi:hypothetical protein
MIIRHDLKLVFLHVPKCAGKELREVFLAGAPEGAYESLFDFAYSTRLHRYVDLAHLPMADLVHWPQFKYLSRYTVVASIRHPEERLTSAANEFYRQRSQAEEALVNQSGLPRPWLNAYLSQLPERHSQIDPRFIHSLPMTWFTHLGCEPMVDHLLRCELLSDQMQDLAETLNWPDEIKDLAAKKLHNAPTRRPISDPCIWKLAQRLYSQDFSTFDYALSDMQEGCGGLAASGTNRWIEKSLSQLEPTPCSSHDADLLSWSESVQWHWGPKCERQEPTILTPTRIQSGTDQTIP